MSEKHKCSECKYLIKKDTTWKDKTFGDIFIPAGCCATPRTMANLIDKHSVKHQLGKDRIKLSINSTAMLNEQKEIVKEIAENDSYIGCTLEKTLNDIKNKPNKKKKKKKK